VITSVTPPLISASYNRPEGAAVPTTAIIKTAAEGGLVDEQHSLLEEATAQSQRRDERDQYSHSDRDRAGNGLELTQPLP